MSASRGRHSNAVRRGVGGYLVTADSQGSSCKQQSSAAQAGVSHRPPANRRTRGGSLVSSGGSLRTTAARLSAETFAA